MKTAIASFDAGAASSARVAIRPGEKKNFFLAYQFADRADLLVQLAGWLRRINHERPCDATGDIPATLLTQELPRLNALPVRWSAADYPMPESAVVSPTGSVRFRETGYSVDPRFLGAPATLTFLATRILIEVGKSRCEHVREDYTNEIRRLPEHSLVMATLITAERKQSYFKRQCLLELGPEAQQFLDRLIMRAYGNTWYRDIHRLFDLYQSHGHAELLAAMGDANRGHTYTYAESRCARALRPDSWPATSRFCSEFSSLRGGVGSGCKHTGMPCSHFQTLRCRCPLYHGSLAEPQPWVWARRSPWSPA